MQDWLDKNFAFIFPFFFVTLWILVGYVIAFIGGWRLLAKRFRAQASFSGQKWGGQSARMRWTTNYNGVLTIGANSSGLFIVPFFLFRAGHPPLLIPWVEMTAARKTQRIFLGLAFDFVELRLGRAEDIPFTIRAKLAAKLEMAAGSSWPSSYFQAAKSSPPPIG